MAAGTSVTLHCGDCLDILPTIPDASVDCVITDPPYPEIDRAYGRMTEAEWWEMMMGVCTETRRILKPTGSAVFILQPNSKHVGSMRPWLFRFQAWCCENWNLIQDAYWWNTTALPIGGAITGGLMRGSIKPCVWAGPSNCYRNQDKVLWEESERSAANRANYRMEKRDRPSGRVVNGDKARGAALTRGGVTPMNVLPIPNADGHSSAGAHGHGAGTPLELAKWWTRYICPPGGTALDPFVGSGTMMLAAMEYGCNGIGIERMPEYFAIAQKRIEQAQMQMPLLEVA